MDTNVSTIEVFQGEDGQWYWRAKARNGEIVATSEGYVSKLNVLRAVQATWSSEIPVLSVEVAHENRDVSGQPEPAVGQDSSEEVRVPDSDTQAQVEGR